MLDSLSDVEQRLVADVEMLELPKAVWQWDLLNNSGLVFQFTYEVSWWKRFWTRVFFGSKWTRIKDD